MDGPSVQKDLLVMVEQLQNSIHIGRCHVTLIEETIGFLNLLGI